MVHMLKPIDSHANFFMMDTHHPSQEVGEHSLGTPPEMLKFWQVWDMLHYSQMHM